jgi:hypothetical protein
MSLNVESSHERVPLANRIITEKIDSAMSKCTHEAGTEFFLRHLLCREKREKQASSHSPIDLLKEDRENV